MGGSFFCFAAVADVRLAVELMSWPPSFALSDQLGPRVCFVPGKSSRTGALSDHIQDPSAPHPREQIVTAPAGSVFVFNAHVWHSGTLNRTRERRRVVHCAFSTSTVRLADPQAQRIRKAVYDRISPAARFLLGV